MNLPTVRVVAHSVNDNGVEMVSVETDYQRFFHSEVMTHRALAKNAASSRAIPTKKLLDVVRNNPAMPVRFGANQGGMQDTGQNIDDVAAAESLWREMANFVADKVEAAHKLNGHKQWVNRPLEPFLPISTVITGNVGIPGYGWDNLFDLRADAPAQPEFYNLAVAIRDAIKASTPRPISWGDWHLPYVNQDLYHLPVRQQCLVSAARVARKSYFWVPDKSIEEDIAFAEDLIKHRHMSPFDQIARAEVISPPSPNKATAQIVAWLEGKSPCPPWADVRHLRGWKPLRAFIENGE